jgi:hypothetical protein
VTTTPARCPWCGRNQHKITYVLVHSEQRHGTAVHSALDLLESTAVDPLRTSSR